MPAKTLLSLEAGTCALVPDVKFRLNVRGEKRKTGRNLLVISTFGLDSAGKERLREAYLADLGDYISFPIKERSEHLYTRVGAKVYNFGHWGRFFGVWLAHFRAREFRIPKKRVLEMVLKVNESETAKLRTYIRNIQRRRRRVLGHFDQNGTQFTEGLLHNNRPLKGGHNCSSWIATAPIGSSQEPLLELLGGDRELEIGTNPGWWSNWLGATASPERVPFAIFWTTLPLAESLATEVFAERNLPWDFHRQ